MGLLLYNNLYATNLVRNQVVQSYRELLPRYVEKQDDMITQIQNYLIKTLNHNVDNQDIRNFNNSPKNSDRYFVSSSNLFLQMSRDIYSFPYADILFIYSENNDSIISFSTVQAREISNMDEHLLNAAKVASLSYINSRWQLVRLGGVPGLFCMTTDGAGSYMGAWVNLSHMIEQVNDISSDSDRGMLLISGDRNTYVGTKNLKDIDKLVTLADNFFDGTPETVMAPNSTLQYILIVEKSAKSDLYYVEAIQERTLLSNLSIFQTMFFILPIIMMIIFAIYFAYLQRVIITPFHSLTKGMQAIGKGNTKFILPETGVEEIQYIIRNFNIMISQIDTMRITAYEDQLQIQQNELDAKKAELRNMQLQINPHFFAISLNIIYSLSAVRDFQTIQKLSLLLSRYFRYIMNSGDGLTELRNELSFVSDYLDIQKLRFTKRLSFSFSIEPDSESFLLPPLTIQPFVENAIIHGYTDPEKGLRISIEVFIEAAEILEFFTIRISDNGNGFPETLLKDFQKSDFLQNGAHSHIGIWNVRTRLQIRYGSRANLRLHNLPDGGACVSLLIPI